MRLWKVLGLAGLAGVAAGGVAVARAERARRAYEPDDVRARLHARLAEAPPEPAAPPEPGRADRARAAATRLRARLTRQG